ncbi:helix-turn-helix domain-containing protein [Bacillus cereus group sp. RP37]
MYPFSTKALSRYFNCQPSDLIEYIPDESSQNNG